MGVAAETRTDTSQSLLDAINQNVTAQSFSMYRIDWRTGRVYYSWRQVGGRS